MTAMMLQCSVCFERFTGAHVCKQMPLPGVQSGGLASEKDRAWRTVDQMKAERDAALARVRELEAKIGFIPWGAGEASLAPLLDRIAQLEAEVQECHAKWLDEAQKRQEALAEGEANRRLREAFDREVDRYLDRYGSALPPTPWSGRGLLSRLESALDGPPPPLAGKENP